MNLGRLFWPDAHGVEQAGYRVVRDVPVLFDDDGQYRRVANRYLRERALSAWEPTGLTIGHRAPAKTTLESIARHLDDFLDWCVAKGTSWTDLSYGDLLSSYQEGLQSGEDADSGRPLANGTVNTRVDVATTFLCWAADRGLRPAFDVRTTTKDRRFTTGGERGTASVTARTERLPEKRSSTFDQVEELPSESEIRDWLLAVRDQRGLAKHLICRFIIETGVRLDEAVSVTEAQWPSAEALASCIGRGRDQVAMTLTHTKGSAPRTINVAVGFALVVRRWIDGHRLRLVAAWMRGHRGEPRPTRLFLSDSRDSEGTPIQRHTVYDLFAEVRPRPAKWSPHMGRHAFACHWILYYLRADASARGAAMTADWVHQRGNFALDLLRRQLGHVSDDTTMMYLQWLQTAVGIAAAANSWHEYLAGTDEGR